MVTNLVEDAVTEYLGERCDEYFDQCVVCQAWRQYDVLCDALRLLAEGTAEEINQWKGLNND